LLWALLVFSIDRAMVVTMKKDPTIKTQPFWIPLISRGLLALLIAFVISIPLELLIFRDQIEIQKKKDEVNTVIETKEKWLIANNVNQDKIEKDEAEKDAEIALANANDCRRDPEFNRLNSELSALERRMNSVVTKTVFNKTLNKNVYTKAYIIARSNYYLKLRERNKRCAEFQNEQRNIANTKLNEASLLKKAIDTNTRIAKFKADTMQTLLKNSFIRDFISLENAAYSQKVLYDTTFSSKQDSTTKQNIQIVDNINTKYEYENNSLLFFLWLIRILFFLIELLPTISKIVTPVGAYDMAIYRREKDFEKELEEGSDAYLEHQKKMQELENKAELELKMEILKLEKEMKIDILKEASEAQNLVARKKIEEFKNKNL
jgi:hypothetical protein